METVELTAKAGADWIGFVFFPKSVRAVDAHAATGLLPYCGDAEPVALLVDADDRLIDEVLATGISVLQLHGKETPDRVAQIKARTGAEIWKAVGVSTGADLVTLHHYDAADRWLLDAKPPEGSEVPGGHGAVFDWSILSGWQAQRPWLLSGGLDDSNVSYAISETGAAAVDVSSGVEASRGLKDAALIEAFIKAAKAA